VQKTKRSGLPETISMRHDPHFVEFISNQKTGPLVRLIQVEKIDPNPRQARCELGNIKELMDSIKTKGVLEPILIRPRGERFEIIAGERRFVATKNVGLSEIPSIIMDVNDSEAMEISLIENLQRKDLDIFEEADGLKALIDIYSYSHADISDKIGKARSTITEIINVSRIPASLRSVCRANGIDKNRSLLIEISKQKTEAEMKALVESIKDLGLKREDTRDLTKMFKDKESGKPARPKHYIFNYRPKDDRSFSVKIEFRKESVNRQEIIKVLEELLSKLKSSR